MTKNNKKGFTLVELLAVVVILSIILVIAVPKVLDVIKDSKKATLESTAKMIASTAEKAKVQNDLLGNTEPIECRKITKLNDIDYASCSIDFDGNTAKITIEGSGKFEGLSVCEGTKTSATAQNEGCVTKIKSIEVEHPSFAIGQTLTPDKFEVTATYSDGSTAKLCPGGLKVDETVVVTTITSPNWPNSYPDYLSEEENYWEKTFEGVDAIQIVFDKSSILGYEYDMETVCEEYCDADYGCEEECWDKKEIMYNHFINIYDKTGKKMEQINKFSKYAYIVSGDYIKVTMDTGYNEYDEGKGFRATIKPMYYMEPEYTISPSVVPDTNENFDITITVKGQNISKKITAKVE